MTKSIRNSIFLLILALGLVNWGGTGHQIISSKASLSFPSTMTGFSIWSDSLKLHASDADTRKSADATESPKHFIDIDNYSEFVSKGRIASTYDSLVSLHGASVVSSNGILPYATRTTYDSLKNCFKKLQWHKAMLFASDLGHYVGDGHMPLHITANYDGRNTGNSGIHSRYESDLVYTYSTTLSSYSGSPAEYVGTNVNNYIFTYIYRNYQYIDSVLKADTYAKGLDATYGSTYSTALWSKTPFTITLLKNASHALADLIYSAWYEAGRPPFMAKTFPTGVDVSNTLNFTLYPNPTQGILNIQGEEIRSAEISSIDGKKLGEFYQNRIDISQLPNGIYILKTSNKNGLFRNDKIVLRH